MHKGTNIRTYTPIWLYNGLNNKNRIYELLSSNSIVYRIWV